MLKVFKRDDLLAHLRCMVQQWQLFLPFPRPLLACVQRQLLIQVDSGGKDNWDTSLLLLRLAKHAYERARKRGRVQPEADMVLRMFRQGINATVFVKKKCMRFLWQIKIISFPLPISEKVTISLERRAGASIATNDTLMFCTTESGISQVWSTVRGFFPCAQSQNTLIQADTDRLRGCLWLSVWHDLRHKRPL